MEEKMSEIAVRVVSGSKPGAEKRAFFLPVDKKSIDDYNVSI
jgi:hypothetical protein